LFLRFQRRDVLVATSEDTTSESDNLVHNLFDGIEDHSRDKSRQIIRKRLKKFVGESLSHKDFRILQGVMTKDFKSTEQVQADKRRRIGENRKLRTMVLNSENQQSAGPISPSDPLANSDSAYLTREKSKISGKHSKIVKHSSMHVGTRMAPLSNDEFFQNPAPSEDGGMPMFVRNAKHLTDYSISMINEEPAGEKEGSSDSGPSEKNPSLRLLVAQLNQEGFDF